MKKYLHILPACFYFTLPPMHSRKILSTSPTSSSPLLVRELCYTNTGCHRRNVNASGAGASLPEGRWRSGPKEPPAKNTSISNTSTEQECPSNVQRPWDLMLHEIDDPDHRRKRSHPDVSWENDDHRPEHCNGVRINNPHTTLNVL